MIRRSWRPLCGTAARLTLGLIGAVYWSRASAGDETGEIKALTRLSLTDLANVEVTSVSKTAENLRSAAASIYVITQEDIQRSGAVRLLEALRLAPNLLVTEIGTHSFTISARGLGANISNQNFSNKLLILIDGRSVYTPLFSGLYSDQIDVMLDDVERIEVISGPGATLWGANAMNGVVNIITRGARDTVGGLAAVGGGNQAQSASLRYGIDTGADASLRAYGLAFHEAAALLPGGGSAHDEWTKGQGGMRYDWSDSHNTLTIQGDAYRATENQLDTSDLLIAGGNLLGRYRRVGESTELQVQGYVDQSERALSGDAPGFVLHTYDLEVQQTVRSVTNHEFVFGGGERVNSYGITGSSGTTVLPESRALTLGNVFLQDSMSFASSLRLVAGLKLEDDPYSGWSPLPDVRVSWTPGTHAALWAAASRAIRSPTPFDEDVVERAGTAVLLHGNPSFQPESVWTYEAGARLAATPVVSVSAAVFYSDYNDLRTEEQASPPSFFPLTWRNLMRGDTDGIELWATWQVTSWWRLAPGATVLHEHFEFKPGAGELVGLTQAGDDPSLYAAVNSSMDLGRRMTLDLDFRHVGALPSPALPAYTEANARLAWRASRTLDLSITGTNLLHARHLEAPVANGGEEIPRSVYAGARWKF